MFHRIFCVFLILSASLPLSAQLSSDDKAKFARCQALHQSGDWEAARDIARGLVDKFASAPASRHKLVFTNELANLNQRLGHHGEAIDGYDQCLNLVTGVLGENSSVEAQLKNNLAALMQTLGDFQTAENLNREALAMRIATDGSDSGSIVPAMNNLGSLLWCIGDYAGAEKLFREALAIRQTKLGDAHLDTGRSLANLGGLLFYRERVQEAAPLAEKAVQIFSAQSGENHPDTMEAMLFLGEIRRAQGETAAALGLYRSCLAGRLLAFGEQPHAEVAEAQSRIADSHREMGNFQEAITAYKESNDAYDAVLRENHPDKVPGLYGASLSTLATGNRNSALNFARRVSEIEFSNLEAILQFTDERQRLAYQEMFRSQHLFANLGAAEDLGTFLLRQKGLVIDSLIAEASLMKDYEDPQINAEIENLRRLRADYRTLFLQGNESVEDAHHAVGQQHTKLLRMIGQSENPALLTDARIQDVQAKLGAGDVLIDYLVYRKAVDGVESGQRYGAVVATPDSVDFVDCAKAESIDALVNTLAGFLSNSEMENDAAASEAMSSLYTQLVQPVLAIAAGSRTLIFCPDAQLSFVPFAATIDEEGRFLVETKNVRYVSASRALLEPESQLRPDRGAILVGNPAFAGASETGNAPAVTADRRGLLSSLGATTLELVAGGLGPLEGAESEVRSLGPILETSGVPSRAIIGAPATERALKDIVQQPYILHLATHGFYLPAFAPRPSDSSASGYSPSEVAGFHNPTFGSWIALTGAQKTVYSWTLGTVPDPGSDGILMANEAAELNLKGTKVVTLSACDTATGEATGGDGVLGIRRGFRMAGAENVLTTLWPINDAVTVEIMKDFYSRMKNESPADALSNVQRDWLVKIRDDAEAVEIPLQDGSSLTVGGLYWSLNLAAPFLLSR